MARQTSPREITQTPFQLPAGKIGANARHVSFPAKNPRHYHSPLCPTYKSLVTPFHLRCVCLCVRAAMEAAKSSPLSSFKSKKQLHSPAPSDQKTRKVPDPELDPNPWSVKTPGKPADPPRRSRHRGAALSIKEIREAALKLRERGSDPPARIDPVVESEIGHVAKPRKSAGAEIKLPEKYELLDKFFNSLDSSIRLLQLKRSATTFTNISPQIETLTDRRFTYSHLAQLKFIMPEAIVVEKVLRHDERTSCMKPDLRITLNVKAIESKSKSKSLSGNLLLRKVFRGRLLDFFKSHPEVHRYDRNYTDFEKFITIFMLLADEVTAITNLLCIGQHHGDEVPEEALPEPFSRLKENASAKSAQPSASSSMSETPNLASFGRQTVAGSHLSPSFKARFAQRGTSHHTANLKQDQSVDSENKFPGSPSGKETSPIAPKSHSKSSLMSSVMPKCSSYTPSKSPPETPVKCINSIKDDEQSSVGIIPGLRTPVDLASTPAKLMSSTPMLNPPKRCYMSPDDNNSYRSPSKLVRRPPPNRPLKFDTPVKNVKVDVDFGGNQSSSTGDDILDILPEALLQSIREKEMLAAMERDPSISQAKRRRQVIASLPKRFDMIYYLFQSIRRSVVTKEELIQKIINGDLEVTDKREVEEQLRLLQELAPEWIYEKSISSGDLLVCVNKISSPEMIRTRLSEAK
ncbi:hypothetical protein DH2020_001381 [Rehmannia glutinosa]|uniref:CDT1 Geminin-binding domain-containing protein n=1 Tax=Rehmannia glutinosa TaxID=99300 RepID=A0ABR0XZ63_REHGL